MTAGPSSPTACIAPQGKWGSYCLILSAAVAGVAIVGACVALAFHAHFRRLHEREQLEKARAALTALEQFRPSIGFYREATEPEKKMQQYWYRHFKPPHPLAKSDCYYFGNGKIADSDLSHLVVRNNCYRPVTMVNLENTAIGNAGLTHLAKLPDLTFLVLDNTHVTDQGLPELTALKKLRWLSLVGTQVTKSGTDKLQSKLPNCFIQAEPRRDAD